MKQPNRYHLWAALECHAFSKVEAVLRFSAEEDGMWVQWQDYASLQAEVERLTDENVTLRMERMQDEKGKRITYADYARLKAEVEQLTQLRDTASWASERAVNRLQAEVERLRKAGDELAWAFSFAVSRHDGEPSGLVKAWNAAKEGKPSV